MIVLIIIVTLLAILDVNFDYDKEEKKLVCALHLQKREKSFDIIEGGEV